MTAGRVLTAGRSENCNITVEHPTVSRRHVELRVNDDGSFDVIDLGASAGTFVFHNGEWTRFQHATVAGDERLRLGSYETTAGELIDMADEGVGGRSGEPQDQDAGQPTEDVHDVTTRRKAERRHADADAGTGEEDRTTRRNGAGTSEKATSKKEHRTVKLPAHHASSEAKRGPAARAAKPQAKPKAPPEIVSPPDMPAVTNPPTERAADPVAATGKGPKSLPIAYLLWLFLGGFGAHRFYLGSIGIGITQAILLVVGVVPVVVFGGIVYDDIIPTVFFLLGVAVLTGLVVWLAVDAFLIPGLIRNRSGKSGAKD